MRIECTASFFWLMCLIGIAYLSVDHSMAVAQSHPAAQAPDVVELPHSSYWKFGLRITATGRTSGVTATVPIPTEWPEQEVGIVSQDKSASVNSARIQKLGQDARQLVIKVSRMNAGDIAEASVTMRITKLLSSPPDDPSKFKLALRTPNQFAKYLQPSPFIESKHDRIQDLAATLPVNTDNGAWGEVKSIYDWVRDNIEYKFDEQIRTCLYALDNRRGDCEEMSSLFIALCRARGIPARAVWIPLHTYPEFYLVDENGDGQWFACQAAGSYAFGYMPEAKPILQKGDKFRVRGHKEHLRYIRPTLTARDAAANPTIDWIMTEVEAPKD